MEELPMSDPRHTDPRYSDSRRPSDMGSPDPLDAEPRSGSGTMWTGVAVIIVVIFVALGLAIEYNRTEQAGNQPNTPTTTGSAPAQPQPTAPANSGGNASQPAAPVPTQGPR